MIAHELRAMNRSPEIDEALTHPSYSNEHNLPYSNQRLEFLGDAILGAVISEYLIKIFPGEDEGTLTKMKAKLTCATWCKKIADQIGLRDVIKIGNGLDRNSMSDAILADAMESVIGAYFLIHGWNDTKNEILSIWNIEKVEYENIDNPKGSIQEFCQKNNLELKYDVDQIDNQFIARLYINSHLISEMTGNSKKEAEVNAAKNALQFDHWKSQLL